MLSIHKPAPTPNTSFVTTCRARATETTQVRKQDDAPDRYDIMLGTCNEDGWDGDNAPALTAAVARVARIVEGRIHTASSKLPPHIAPGVDGTIGFEFYNRAGSIRKLFIEARPDGTVRAYYVTTDNKFEKFPPANPLEVMDKLRPTLTKIASEVRNIG